jgi:hypothetical protein
LQEEADGAIHIINGSIALNEWYFGKYMFPKTTGIKDWCNGGLLTIYL